MSLFQLPDDRASTLARFVVLGIAVVLLKAGVQTRKDLKGLDLQAILKQLPELVRSVVQQKAVVREEFRILTSFGPKRYIDRKSRELRNL